jgi:hypothetical protein
MLKKEASKETEPVGVSAGFLSSIIQLDQSVQTGIRYNLTMDTIQSIYKMFPAGFLRKKNVFKKKIFFNFFRETLTKS